MTDDPQSPPLYDPAAFVELAQAKMPFGKYAGRLLIDLPEHYLVWFSQKGFPKGQLGTQLRAVLELKANGLTHLLKKIPSR